MKVLQVNDYVTCGGCEAVVTTTTALLRDRGVEVDLFTARDVPGLRRSPIGYVDSRAARRTLAERLDAFRPDVVHLHNFYHLLSPGILATLAAARRHGSLRVVMTAHDYHLVCPNAGLFHVRRGRLHTADPSRLKRPAYLLTRRWDRRGIAFSLLKTAQHVWNYRLRDRRRVIDRVLCPSRYLEQALAPLDLPTSVVPYPLPPTPPRDARAGRPERLQLVFAGRIEPEKGLAEFLSALPAGFPGRLLVVGEGSERPRCEAIIRRRGLDARVELVGWRPRAGALSIIGRSHVLVLPSLWVENQPMSMLEALALGTNLLVSDLGGMREIVQDAGVGFTFAPYDAGSLRAALQEVLAAHGNGALNGFDVREFLSRRDEDSYVDRLLTAYGLRGA